MGGVGFGLRSSKQINPMNPASYSCMDSLTFLFDFGASGQLSWFDDGVNKQHNINGNVEYIAMQFPIHKRIAMSVGILPLPVRLRMNDPLIHHTQNGYRAS